MGFGLELQGSREVSGLKVEAIRGNDGLMLEHVDVSDGSYGKIEDVVKKLKAEADHKAQLRKKPLHAKDEVMWRYEISGCGEADVNGVYERTEHERLGCPVYMNTSGIMLSREEQPEEDNSSKLVCGWILGKLKESKAIYGVITDDVSVPLHGWVALAPDIAAPVPRALRATRCIEEASDLKVQGNLRGQKESNWTQALVLYTKGLEILSTPYVKRDKETNKLQATLFSNRSEAKLRLGYWKDAEEDALSALKLIRSSKNFGRQARALRAQGRYKEAVAAFRSALRLEENEQLQCAKAEAVALHMASTGSPVLKQFKLLVDSGGSIEKLFHENKNQQQLICSYARALGALKIFAERQDTASLRLLCEKDPHNLRACSGMGRLLASALVSSNMDTLVHGVSLIQSLASLKKNPAILKHVDVARCWAVALFTPRELQADLSTARYTRSQWANTQLSAAKLAKCCNDICWPWLLKAIQPGRGDVTTCAEEIFLDYPINKRVPQLSDEDRARLLSYLELKVAAATSEIAEVRDETTEITFIFRSAIPDKSTAELVSKALLLVVAAAAAAKTMVGPLGIQKVAVPLLYDEKTAPAALEALSRMLSATKQCISSAGARALVQGLLAPSRGMSIQCDDIHSLLRRDARAREDALYLLNQWAESGPKLETSAEPLRVATALTRLAGYALYDSGTALIDACKALKSILSRYQGGLCNLEPRLVEEILIPAFQNAPPRSPIRSTAADVLQLVVPTISTKLGEKLLNSTLLLELDTELHQSTYEHLQGEGEDASSLTFANPELKRQHLDSFKAIATTVAHALSPYKAVSILEAGRYAGLVSSLLPGNVDSIVLVDPCGASRTALKEFLPKATVNDTDLRLSSKRQSFFTDNHFSYDLVVLTIAGPHLDDNFPDFLSCLIPYLTNDAHVCIVDNRDTTFIVADDFYQAGFSEDVSALISLPDHMDLRVFAREGGTNPVQTADDRSPPQTMPSNASSLLSDSLEDIML